MLYCALVVLGWLVHVPALVAAPAGSVAMVLPTAIALGAVGAALLWPPAATATASRARAGCAVIVSLMACVGVLEHAGAEALTAVLANWHKWLDDGNPVPGRMAPNTCAALAACSVVLFTMGQVRGRAGGLTVQLATLAVLGLGITGLLGYSLQFSSLYPGFRGARMAPNTAVMLIGAAAGLWLCWRDAAWYQGRRLFADDEKVVILGTGLVVVMALSAGVSGFAAQHVSVEEQLIKDLEGTLKRRVALVQDVLLDSDRWARRLAANPVVTGAASAQAEATPAWHTLDQLLAATSMQGVLLLDLEGRVLARAGRMAATAQLDVTLRDLPGVSIFFDREVMLRHRLPVMVQGRQAGTLLVERLLPAISQHLRSGAEVGPSGEVELCVRRQTVLECFPQARRKEPYTLAIDAAARFPMARAVAGESGVMRGRDSRGAHVVAAYRPLDAGALGMIIKQDSAELMAPLMRQLEQSALLLSILVLASAYLLRSALRPLAQRLVQSEQLALARESHIHAVLDNVDEGIVTIDPAGRIEQCNAAACRLFQRSAACLTGQALAQLVNGPLDLHAAAARRLPLRTSALRADGTPFPVELTLTLLLQERLVYVAIVTDCTLRDAAEAAVRRSHDELEQQVAARTAELRALAAHQETIREDERKRIAREIHDELGGVLSGIRSYLSYAQEQVLRQGGPAEGPLHEAGLLADSAIDTVRRVITDLRPSVLDHLGLWAALEWYAGQVGQRSGLECVLALDPACTGIEPDPERATALFRIVQETLTNVVRHAGAARASIRATLEAGDEGKRIVIVIADDGRGVQPADMRREQSWGVIGMHERVRHFGGTLAIDAAAAGGTVVTVCMPLKDQADA